MIPATWTPVHRESDGELVGYLADGVPMTLIGHPLGSGSLEVDGLVALDGKWLCRLPNPMPPGTLDASMPEPDWERRYVVIAETNPRECRIRLAMEDPDEQRSQATLPVPVGGLLMREE